MSKLEESNRLIAEAKGKYAKAIQDAIDPGLKYIAETYGEELGIISIIGWTPGFNDGEPCEHTTEHLYGYSALDSYGLEHLVEEWFDTDRYEELLEKPPVSPAKEVKEFVYGALENWMNEKYQTNYRVHVIFENGTYRIEDDEYDCGY